jgi:hypothetical protein
VPWLRLFPDRIGFPCSAIVIIGNAPTLRGVKAESIQQFDSTTGLAADHPRLYQSHAAVALRIQARFAAGASSSW